MGFRIVYVRVVTDKYRQPNSDKSVGLECAHKLCISISHVKEVAPCHASAPAINSENAMSYSEDLNDPRWIVLTSKVLRRDEYICQDCGIVAIQPHIHHRYYSNQTPRLKPWMYPISTLRTLCKECHERITKQAPHCVICGNRVTIDQGYGWNGGDYFCEYCAVACEEERYEA